MAMYLAGLAGIPEEQLEAASDGRRQLFRQLRHIMLPQLWPVTVTCLILLLHISLKIFDLVVAMSGSGPGFVTDVPGIYIYDMMGKANRYDKGTAAAIVLLLTACIFVVPYLIRVYRKERELMSAVSTPPSKPDPVSPVPAKAPPTAAHWRPRTAGQWVILIVCVLLLIYFVFPVYVIISTALKGPGAAAGSSACRPRSTCPGSTSPGDSSRATCGTRCRSPFPPRSSPASSAR